MAFPTKHGWRALSSSFLKPAGRFVVVNWHQRPREETIVLGKPRGPKTDVRITPDEVAVVVAPAGLRSLQLIELPPYHYAAIFERPAK